MKQVVNIKVFLILPGLLFLQEIGFAQSYWIKPLVAIDARQSLYFYQNSRLNAKPSFIISTARTSRGILGLGLARAWKNGSFTEVAIFHQKNSNPERGFYFDTMGTTVTSRTSQIGHLKERKFVLALDHIFLLTKPEKAFRFYAGGSMMIHTTNNDFKAEPFYYFDMDKRFSNLDLGGAMKLAYTIVDNLWAELGINAGLISFGVENSQVSNPVLTPNQQKSTIFDVDLLSSSNFRLGLGYRFYNKKVKK